MTRDKEKEYKDYYTFDEILSVERKHGWYIHPMALIDFFKRAKLFNHKNADHVYYKNVFTLIAQNREDIMKDSYRYQDEDEKEALRQDASSRFYHPKGMSRASMELLRGDDIFYDDYSHNNIDDSIVAGAVMESLKKFLKDNAAVY